MSYIHSNMNQKTYQNSQAFVPPDVVVQGHKTDVSVESWCDVICPKVQACLDCIHHNLYSLLPLKVESLIAITQVVAIDLGRAAFVVHAEQDEVGLSPS
jgi:hypothetical protein